MTSLVSNVTAAEFVRAHPLETFIAVAPIVSLAGLLILANGRQREVREDGGCDPTLRVLVGVVAFLVLLKAANYATGDGSQVDAYLKNFYQKSTAADYFFVEYVGLPLLKITFAFCIAKNIAMLGTSTQERLAFH